MASGLDFIEAALIERRRFLIGSALAAGSLLLPAGARRAFAASDLQFASSIRSLSNAFHVAWDKGSKAYADTVGAPYAALVTEGNSEKGIADIKAMLAKVGNKLVLGVDPNDVPDARPIVEAVAKAGAHVVTVWNKPDDLHPWDFGDHYVSHMTWSDEGPAEQTARILMDAMGKKGGVVHLGGIASNNPAIERLNGLKKALKDYPDVQLLDAQPADWDTQKANQVMAGFITRYGDEIKGVHCANDTIAYGVLEALRAEGIEGMPVVSYDGNQQAVELVAKGQILATVFTNPYWGGGISAALAYYAATGAFKPSSEPKEHREFYGPTILVTPKDAQEFKAKYLDSNPKYDWKDFWGPSKGQIQYKS